MLHEIIHLTESSRTCVDCVHQDTRQNEVMLGPLGPMPLVPTPLVRPGPVMEAAIELIASIEVFSVNLTVVPTA